MLILKAINGEQILQQKNNNNCKKQFDFDLSLNWFKISTIVKKNSPILVILKQKSTKVINATTDGASCVSNER